MNDVPGIVKNLMNPPSIHHGRHSRNQHMGLNPTITPITHPLADENVEKIGTSKTTFGVMKVGLKNGDTALKWSVFLWGNLV